MLTTFYIGTHTHGHGTDTYLLSGDSLTVEDLAALLGDEYEPERGETLELLQKTPIPVERRPAGAAARSLPEPPPGL